MQAGHRCAAFGRDVCCDIGGDVLKSKVVDPGADKGGQFGVGVDTRPTANAVRRAVRTDRRTIGLKRQVNEVLKWTFNGSFNQANCMLLDDDKLVNTGNSPSQLGLRRCNGVLACLNWGASLALPWCSVPDARALSG